MAAGPELEPKHSNTACVCPNHCAKHLPRNLLLGQMGGGGGGGCRVRIGVAVGKEPSVVALSTF